MLRKAISGAMLAGALALGVPALAEAAPPAMQCTGNPDRARDVTLRVEGQPATGHYVAPERRPTVAVVMGHGYSFASDGWVPHLRLAAGGSGALAVAMDYRGLVFLGDDPEDTWPYERSRGYPVAAGSEDLVAAGQAVLESCPSVRHLILLGVSMGGNATGMAAALDTRRPNGEPLWDYWIGVEGVYNLIELYEAANAGQAISPFVAQVKEDIEIENGGTPQTRPAEYRFRTVVTRTDDIAASGLKGVILIHAREDGLALYPQAQELSQLLREQGVPTDFYTVGSRGPDDDPDTTLAGYGGVDTGQAGHGPEVSENHVVIDEAFIRMQRLIEGAPPPCDRDFQVEGDPYGVTPDPASATARCPAGEPLGAKPNCRLRPPKLFRLRARQRNVGVRVRGVVRPSACPKGAPRVRAKGSGAAGVPREYGGRGRFAILLRGVAAESVKVVARDRGPGSRAERVRVRS
jgi:hypothetical protein